MRSSPETGGVTVYIVTAGNLSTYKHCDAGYIIIGFGALFANCMLRCFERCLSACLTWQSGKMMGDVGLYCVNKWVKAAVVLC